MAAEEEFFSFLCEDIDEESKIWHNYYINK